MPMIWLCNFGFGVLKGVHQGEDGIQLHHFQHPLNCTGDPNYNELASAPNHMGMASHQNTQSGTVYVGCAGEVQNQAIEGVLEYLLNLFLKCGYLFERNLSGDTNDRNRILLSGQNIHADRTPGVTPQYNFPIIA